MDQTVGGRKSRDQQSQEGETAVGFREGAGSRDVRSAASALLRTSLVHHFIRQIPSEPFI